MRVLKVVAGDEVCEALWHKSKDGEWACIHAWRDIKWMEGMKDPETAKAELERRKLPWHWHEITRHHKS